MATAPSVIPTTVSENFTDSFTYRVTDNDGQTADATVTINVTPVSDETPVANADSISVGEGGTITTLVGGSSTVLNNDTGLGDTPVTVSLVTDVTNGSLTLNGDGPSVTRMTALRTSPTALPTGSPTTTVRWLMLR